MTPVLGFGFDYRYREQYPGGLDALCGHYREQLSHVSFVCVEGVDEVNTVKRTARGLPIVHHLSKVSPASPGGPDLERLREQDVVTRLLDAVWVGEDIGIWSMGPYSLPYFAPPLFEAEIADVVADGISAVLRESSVPFLAEVPSCSFVAGRLGVGEFFHRLVERSGCGIVLDLGHVYSYALAADRPALEVMLSLPLASVVEIHIAGGQVEELHPSRYVDTHSTPILDPVLSLLAPAVERCPRLRAVTYELGIGLSSELIASDFERVASVLRGANFVPAMGHNSLYAINAAGAGTAARGQA
jgi:uncharacterized protein (UPF0276 family)